MGVFSIIITAGGIGKRMGADIPKQFVEIGGKPILIRTLELFYNFDQSAQIVITLPGEWKTYWSELLTKHQCSVPHEVVDGGTERYHSIKNALKLCNGGYIAVHDAVRPFVSQATLERCFSEVKQFGQVVPVIPLKETIRQIFDDTSRTVNRSEYCIVQTPQCFKKEIIEKAYNIDYHSGITDDAGLVEEAGFLIHLVEGNEENIKITSRLDLALAEQLLAIRD